MSVRLEHLRSVAFGALATIVGVGGAAVAAPVVLTVDDGSVSIAGDLVSVEDGFFVINTTLGSMRIAASRVTCDGEGCPVAAVSDDVLIAGSSTIGSGMMPLLLTGFADNIGAAAEMSDEGGLVVAHLMGDDGFGDPVANFMVNASASSAAFQALLDGSAQIGMSSRRIEPGEARNLRNVGGGNMIDPTQEHIVAVDSVVVIVNQANPVRDISLADLDRIYSGQLTNWSALGGEDAPITVYGREDGSGTGELFESRIFEASGRRKAASVTTISSDEEMASAVNSDPNGIGFVGFAFQRGAKPLDIVSECGITARPDAFTSKAEEYPLQRRLYLYNRADNLSEATQNFLAYAESDEADGVIAKSGFIDLGVDRDRRENQGGRVYDTIANTVDAGEINLMREMVVEMLQYDRLSTTFRFASGSASLEAKAIADLERLIVFINQFPGSVEISFVGFSDSDGSFEANRSLSVGRAQQVAATVANFAAGRVGNNVVFTSKGFGELSPSACNTSLEGKRTNRRVEVWIRRL